MEKFALLTVGLLICVFGIVNMTGNISTIHSYNRKKVKEEDRLKYGRAVGLGTLIVGVGILVGFVLEVMALTSIVPFAIIPAVVIGLAFILYGQFKYNKGLF